MLLCPMKSTIPNRAHRKIEYSSTEAAFFFLYEQSKTPLFFVQMDFQ